MESYFIIVRKEDFVGLLLAESGQVAHSVGENRVQVGLVLEGELKRSLEVVQGQVHHYCPEKFGFCQSSSKSVQH